MLDYYQLNSDVTSIAPAVPAIVTITESAAQTDGTWHTLLDTATTFFPIPFGLKAKGLYQFVFMAKPCLQYFPGRLMKGHY